MNSSHAINSKMQKVAMPLKHRKNTKGITILSTGNYRKTYFPTRQRERAVQ